MTKAIFLPKRSDYGMRTTTRYITTHNAAGDGVFGPSPELHALDRNGYEMTRVYGVASVPANLSADVDMDAYTSDDIESNPTSYANTGVTITNGVNFLNVDLGPGAQTVMHRTVTVDFVVVVEGQIELVLDSGERQLLRSGVRSHITFTTPSTCS